MKRLPRLASCVSILAITLFAATPVLAQTRQLVDVTSDRLAAATSLLQGYRVSHSLKDLKEAALAFGTALAVTPSAMRPEDRILRRRAIIDGMAQVLREVEFLEDPTFDPMDTAKNGVPWCLMPPREPNGHQASLCADPKDISDAVTRGTYIEAIRQRNAKSEYVTTQSRVRLIERVVMIYTQGVLDDFRPKTMLDNVELDKILRRASISDTHRSQIGAMF